MITGFLDKDAAKFSKALWGLLLSAQNGAQGVPQELLEAKKQELEQERVRLLAISSRREYHSNFFTARRRTSPRGGHKASAS